MRFKLDENLGLRGARALRAAGHDVATVSEQGMTSAADPAVIDACLREKRCLVTLDLGFANPLTFDPARHCGIVVLRVPPRAGFTDLEDLFATLVKAVESGSITGKLWIVEPGRFREYSPDR